MDNVINITPNTELDAKDWQFIQSIYKFMFDMEFIYFGEFCLKMQQHIIPYNSGNAYDVKFGENDIEIWKTEDHELKQKGEAGFIRIS